MKTYNKPATSKLLKRFDNELKQLLMEDLKVFRAKNFQRNNQPALQQQAAWSIYTSTYKIYLSILWKATKLSGFGGLCFLSEYCVISSFIIQVFAEQLLTIINCKNIGNSLANCLVITLNC